MGEFRIGDIVECVDNNSILLSKGELYEVTNIKGNQIYGVSFFKIKEVSAQTLTNIYLVWHMSQWFHISRFKLSKYELREEKLNQLLNEKISNR